MKKTYYKLTIILIYFLNVNYCKKNDCRNSNFSLFQQIENNGFHRNIKYYIELNSTKEQQLNECSFIFKQLIPSGAFVDPHSINQPQTWDKKQILKIGFASRKLKLKWKIEGHVDIEASENRAEAHAFLIFENITTETKWWDFIIPVNFRYHRAKIGRGKYSKVIFDYPSILLNCRRQHVLDHICGIKVEYADDDDVMIILKNVTYNKLSDGMEVLIPVGNVDDYPLVSIITLLLTCTGCIYLLSVMIVLQPTSSPRPSSQINKFKTC